METALNGYSVVMIAVFIIGYLLITVEHITRINKATVALLMAVICWIIQFADPTVPQKQDTHNLLEHLGNISQIVFFLLGALTIVEIINVHKGFAIVSDAVRTANKRKLLWIIGLITFFLSAVLDNLTTTIVMISLVQKLIDDRNDRMLIGGAVVIAANAGGAWTPIGDVTTTMLWIGGQISTWPVMRDLFIPSIVCLLAALIYITVTFGGEFKKENFHRPEEHLAPWGGFVFFLGISSLIFVPIFKLITGLPPFMAILFSLSALWVITDIVHYGYRDREHLRVPTVLGTIDISSILFFLGVLLCVGALESAGILSKLALWLDHHVGNTTIIATLIGIASAVVDNVPLVAATMGMYNLQEFPPDSRFWQLVAYCAGTGGSMLVIGSAAGVVFMAMEKVNFFWYLKKIAIPAAIGYFAGIGAYLLLMG